MLCDRFVAREVRDTDRQITVLLQKAAIRRSQGDPAAMLQELSKVESLLVDDPQVDRLLLLGVYQEKALAYLETGNDSDTRRYLSRAHAICDEIGYNKSRDQLRWIDAQLSARAGDEVKAERELRLSRAGLIEAGDRAIRRMVALDLATVCHRQGRFPEVLSLVISDVLPALEEVRQRPEARVALELLHRAVAAERISITVLRQAREALAEAHNDPKVRMRSTE